MHGLVKMLFPIELMGKKIFKTLCRPNCTCYSLQYLLLYSSSFLYSGKRDEPIQPNAGDIVQKSALFYILCHMLRSRDKPLLFSGDSLANSEQDSNLHH